ncbi:unnamed protein product [Cunninghamella blakesleeana]
MSPLLSRIQSNTQLYQRLRKELSEESSILVEIEDGKARRGLLTEKLNNLYAEVETLTKQLKKEYSALHKARHFSEKKALIAKEEAGYQDAFEKEQRARRELEIVKTEFNNTTDKVNRLQHQADHLKNINQQLNNLLDEVFYEPDATEIRENQIRAELQNYIEQHALAKNDSQRFLDANYNLVQALRNIKKAKELINLTLNFVSFDLFGSSIIDDQQIMYVQGCQQSVWEAQRGLNMARQILPEIPYPGSLDVVTNNHMLGLRFDGGYVDSVWQAKTQQGYNLLVSVEPAIKNASQWVADYLRYTNGALEKLTSTKEATYNRLLDERMRIFDRVISGNQRTSIYESGSTSANNQDLQSPPPVYTAPARTDTQNVPLPEINSPITNTNYNIDSKHGANINDNNSNHLLNISSSSSPSSHHLRTASQSSSIAGSTLSQPPPQPSAPPTNPFTTTTTNNNNYQYYQNGQPMSPITSNFYNNNNNGMQGNPHLSSPSSPSSSSQQQYAFNNIQNDHPSSSSSFPFNNNNNNNINNIGINTGMQGNPPSSSSSSQFYNNNGIQNGSPLSPSSPSSHTTQKPNLKHSPELSSSSINPLQNQPLSPSSTGINNNMNSNNVQGQPQRQSYTSSNENNPFRDTKHLVTES